MYDTYMSVNIPFTTSTKMHPLYCYWILISFPFHPRITLSISPNFIFTISNEATPSSGPVRTLMHRGCQTSPEIGQQTMCPLGPVSFFGDLIKTRRAAGPRLIPLPHGEVTCRECGTLYAGPWPACCYCPVVI